MAELSVTAANVIPVTGYTFETGIAGETITAGMPVYLKAADSRLWKAGHNGTSAIAAVVGISLHAALAGQPLRYQTSGSLGFGAILTVGVTYILGNTLGSIAVDSDAGTTDYKTILGVASATSNMLLKIFASGAIIA